MYEYKFNFRFVLDTILGSLDPLPVTCPPGFAVSLELWGVNKFVISLHFSISWDVLCISIQVCSFVHQILRCIAILTRYCFFVHKLEVLWKFHWESIYIPSASNQFSVHSRPSLIYSIRKSTSVTSPSTSTHPVFNFLFFSPAPNWTF